MNLAALNRRRKAALCLTLAASGFGFLAGGLRGGVGLLLLGIAFAWAFGCNSRWVHTVFLAAGLVIMAWAGLTWHRHAVELAAYRQSLRHKQRTVKETGSSEAKTSKFWAAMPLAGSQQARPVVGHVEPGRIKSEAADAKAKALAGAALLGVGLGLLIGVKPQRGTP